jgi:hypothetical protein
MTGQTRTDVIAVLSPDNGDGTMTVATMTYSTEPAPGDTVTDHGETVVTVRREPPRAPGAAWVAPYSVNCGVHGLVASLRDKTAAGLAARSHIAAHRPKMRVYRSHEDAAGVAMCEYHAPLITARPGTFAHLQLCPEAGHGARVCTPIALPDDAVCEQCARCGIWSTSLSCWLV